MRAHRQVVLPVSIEKFLHEPGCPLCRFLKDFQAIHLQQGTAKDIHRLCNFHAWGVAAVQDALAAADVFLALVNENRLMADQRLDCDICLKLVEEEDRRIRELVTLLGKPDIVRWLRTEAVFCIPHAVKLRQKVPLTLTARIDAIIQSYREQLKGELTKLRDNPTRDRSGYGALGRAAEFLVSQRGLRA